MISLVRFRTGEGLFAVAVAHAREVRDAADVRPMGSLGPGIVGLLPRDGDALTVVATLGPGTGHVLVLDCGDGAFGLLVEEVSGVLDVADDDIDPPPSGQQNDLVAGMIRQPDGIVLLVDVKALARELAQQPLIDPRVDDEPEGVTDR